MNIVKTMKSIEEDECKLGIEKINISAYEKSSRIKRGKYSWIWWMISQIIEKVSMNK